MEGFARRWKSLVLAAAFGMPGGLAFADPSCSEFIEKMKASSVKSVDQVLAALSEDAAYAEFMKRYAFIYESGSIQKGTPEKPRAMVYGTDAKMVLTFLNEKQADGRDAVEMLCWNEERREFELMEFDFGKKKLPFSEPIEKNPQRCLACHGNPPRPNFDPYNTWAGTYGSLARDVCSVIHKNSKEYSMYQSFMEHSRGFGRYAFLPKEIPPGRCPDDAKEITVRNGAETAPTENLLNHYNALNRQRVAQIISRHPNFEKFKYAIAAVARGCENAKAGRLEEFFPQSIRDSGMSYAETQQDTKRVVDEEYAARLAKFKENNAASPTSVRRQPLNFIYFSSSDLPVTAQMRYLMDKMGADMTRWTTGFKNGTYDFSTGNSTQSREIQSIFRTAVGSLQNESCVSLLASSRKVLDGQDACETPQKILFNPSFITDIVNAREVVDQLNRADAKKALHRCLECHDDDSIRKFPFADENRLRLDLKKDPDLGSLLVNRITGLALRHGQSQMPPSPMAKLTKDEQEIVIRYLASLEGEVAEKSVEQLQLAVEPPPTGRPKLPVKAPAKSQIKKN